MAKDYNTFSDVSTGDVYTAAAHNLILENVNNYRVPPMCRVYRSSDLTSYSSGTAITWNAEDYDTDGMFTASSTDITINTAGIYLVVLNIYWTASATVATASAGIVEDGSTIQSKASSDGSATGGVVHQTGVFSFPAATVLTSIASFSGGSNYAIKGTAAANSNANSHMSVTWLGQAS